MEYKVEGAQVKR